jgi:hypothetical protein
MWVAEFSNMDETHVLPKYQAVKQVQLKHGHQIIDFEKCISAARASGSIRG